MSIKKPEILGVQVIESFVATLPALSGVYRMLDSAGNFLYVGKAKSLKKRVLNYTQPEKQCLRIQRMIAMTAHMEFTTTHTEAEALLLEANLIKKLKPRYNILLRDDKSFPYILITGDHAYPQVVKHRGAKDRKGEYFGPFASGAAVNETIEVLHKAFQLRNCSDSIFALRTRPCLQYQIKRCTAPCVQKVTHAAYAKQVDMARQFLSGKSREIQDYFAGEMQTASEKMDFEAAAVFRDRIRMLTQIQSHQMVNVEGLEDADIHAIYQENGQSCIEVFFFRNGQNFGNRAYFPRHEKDENPCDILSAFIIQFYSNKPIPKEIIINTDITDKEIILEALQIKSGHKTDIILPQRGAKKELIEMAEKNAKEALKRKFSTDTTQNELLKKLAETLGLSASPARIEVYDNSHLSGTHALGAMIVVGAEGFQKTAYRKFNMDAAHIKAGDDVAMMREMLTRRFKALTADTVKPDLLLIDGGQGQLNAVLKVLKELGITDIPVVGIAKGEDRNAGRERLFIQGKPPLSLEQDDPVLHFLQRIRDESHRFVISSHRAKRSKAIVSNPLDEIAGIGGKRKKALLLHFGSAKAVAEAGMSDLQKVEGISKTVAEKIYNFFHENE
jgi:excinuclease ABC subunit C